MVTQIYVLLHTLALVTYRIVLHVLSSIYALQVILIYYGYNFIAKDEFLILNRSSVAHYHWCLDVSYVLELEKFMPK